MTSNQVLVLGYAWILFCGWAKERGQFGPEFWLAAVSPVLAIVAFLIALLFNLMAPPSAVLDVLLLLFYGYFLLPVPGMTGITGSLGWRPKPQKLQPSQYPLAETLHATDKSVAADVPQQSAVPPSTSHPSLQSALPQYVLGKGRAADVTFSELGDSVAVASPLGAYLYETAHLSETARFSCDQRICCVAISTATGLLVAGDDEYHSRIHVWRTRENTFLGTLDLSAGGNAPRLTFSPDGRMLACGGDLGLQAWMLEPEVVKARRLFAYQYPNELTRSVSFTEDGVFLAWDCKGTEIGCHVWNMTTVTQHMLPEESEALASMEPICAQLHTASPLMTSNPRDEVVQLWNYRTNTVVATLELKQHLPGTRKIVLSPRGDCLAGITQFGAVWVIEPVTGKQIISPERSGDVWVAAFSRDARVLATGDHDDDDHLEVCSLPGAQPTLRLDTYGKSVGFLAFSPNAALLSSEPIGAGDAHLWSLADGRELLFDMGHASSVIDVTFDADGHSLACAGKYGEVQEWRVDTGMRVDWHRRKAYTQTRLLRYAADGRLVAVVDDGYGMPLRLWNVRADQPIATFPGLQPPVLFPQVLVGNGELRLWDTVSVKAVAGCKGLSSGGGTAQPAISSDGTRLAYGVPHTVKVFRIGQGSRIVPEIELQTGTGSAIWRLAFSDDARFLAAVGDENFLLLWDLNEGAGKPQVFRSETMREGFGVCFSKDGRYVATGGGPLGRSAEGVVELWDTHTGELKRTFVAHREVVRCVALSPNGQYLASGSEDGTVCLWQVNL